MKFGRFIDVILRYMNCKTFFFNFHYLPFKEAIYLPFFLSRNTKLRRVGGSVILCGPLKPGMIRMGTSEIGLYDKKHNRTVWENSGVVTFQGSALIKYGARIIVGKDASLKLGNGFRISSGTSIICYKSIEFGNDCRISWDSQIIDTDFHRIFDSHMNHINPDKEIKIGNNCWIGNHCRVHKGTVLGNMVVLSSSTMVNASIPDNNVILAGSPAKIIRTSITWGE
jgi:acetyltransferase-like isoleucine patch superfamily enzyme